MQSVHRSSCVTCRHLQNGHRTVMPAFSGTLTLRCMACLPVLSSSCKVWRTCPQCKTSVLQTFGFVEESPMFTPASC